MEKIETPVAPAVLSINIEEVSSVNVEPVLVIQTPVEEYTPEQQKFIISDEVLNAIPEVEIAQSDLPFSAFANPTPVDETVHAVVVQQAAANPDISGTEIASIKSAFYGGFIKTLETVSPGLGSEDVVSIKEGRLVITKSGGIISCDLSSVFGKNSWNLKDPTNNLKKLKLIKGGDKVTIMNDDTKYIIYSSAGQDIKTICTITKVNENASTFIETKEIDPGTLKSKTVLPLEVISNLIAAKSLHGSIYYNITLDAVTYDLLSIDIDDKHKEILKSETGRETVRYKVKELFPVAKPDSIILEVYESGDQLFIKTLNDVIMTTINLQIAALKNTKRDDLNFDRMM
jgi:hypothetical protein